MIEIRSFSFSYVKQRHAIDDLSLTIRPGKIVNILGPNGSGKSTLLKAMLGLLPVRKGSIAIDGQDIADMSHVDLAKRLNYVPQQHHGIFNYRMMDIVMMARTSGSLWLGYSAKDYPIARQALEKIRMTHFADRPYLELSGGERQLVMIARALAQGGQYFIMDEPVTGLDYGNQFHLLETIQSLASSVTGDHAPACILATHHPEPVRFLGGRAILMSQGRIIADGASRKIITPEAICSLYGLSPTVLEKLSSFNGKKYELASHPG